ncbi:VanZ family protein [Negadavirga shengliensis]|uniref:VanZ family protein n=1 Tax=Negadavirga shengliensis TaxID=1389218 RepID=A0ABV9T4J7_9BACT
MKKRLIPALIWTIGVLYAIFSPGSNVPKIPKFFGSDKLIHFMLFFGLVFLWNRVINEKPHPIEKKNRYFFTNYLVFWILFAIFTEYMQRYVPGRSFDGWDIVANALGGTIGTVVFVYLNKRKSALV